MKYKIIKHQIVFIGYQKMFFLNKNNLNKKLQTLYFVLILTFILDLLQLMMTFFVYNIIREIFGHATEKV